MDQDTHAGRRVALLVDGDNVAPAHAPRLLAAAAAEGGVVVRRAYGGVGAVSAWASAPAFRTVCAGAGKNAADLLLAIEAVALAAEGRADAFVLASSDRDFAHLAHHLRERGLPVTGLGDAKAPAAFREACTRFVEIDEPPAPPSKPAPAAKPAPKAKPAAASAKPAPKQPALTDRDRALRDAIGPEGAAIAQLGSTMKVARVYLTARPHFYACDPKGEDARVRWIGPRP
jgi:hypothetical protein